jgi:hypothetical protein
MGGGTSDTLAGAKLGEETRVITVLVCSILTVNCTADTALEIYRLQPKGLMCNPYPEIAELAIGRDIRPDERVVVKCPSH